MIWLCVLLGCCERPLPREDQCEVARSCFAAGIVVGALTVAVIARTVL